MTLDERFEWINKNIESLHASLQEMHASLQETNASLQETQVALNLLSELTVKNTEAIRDIVENTRIQNESTHNLATVVRSHEQRIQGLEEQG